MADLDGYTVPQPALTVTEALIRLRAQAGPALPPVRSITYLSSLRLAHLIEGIAGQAPREADCEAHWYVDFIREELLIEDHIPQGRGPGPAIARIYDSGQVVIETEED